MAGEPIIYKPLCADDGDLVPTELESLCVNCEENGITRLLLTRIPFYKDIILMSFLCDNCGYRNNEIQSGTKIQEQGIRYILKIKNKEDLNRCVVKSKFAGVTIPEADFEIPQNSQAGEVTTVEGIISRAIDNLKMTQHSRRATNSTQADLVDEFLLKFSSLLNLDKEFTLILDDPSGDSFVENSNPRQIDIDLKIIHYVRTIQQDKMLALLPDDAEISEEDSRPIWESKDTLKNEVLHFAINCPSCGKPTQTNMKLVNIPYFKEVVIMATNCDHCGIRTSEVKSGAGIAERGVRLTLKLRNEDDLKRDVLKSETCNVFVPQLDMELGMGILAGRFTTVEGLLTSIKTELIEHGGFVLGDSAECVKKESMENFLKRLDDVIGLKTPVELILDDPAGNSYVQSYTDLQTDDRLKVEYYERTFEQNDELGINDMKTENYSEQNCSNVKHMTNDNDIANSVSRKISQTK